MNRIIGGHQSLCGHYEEQKNLFLLSGIELRYIYGPFRSSHYTNWANVATYILCRKENFLDARIALNFVFFTFLYMQ
jgi:hypothetical protein